MNQVMLIYFAFLATALPLYYIIPKRFRWIALLVFSLGFYAVISRYLIVFVLTTSLSVYLAARFFIKEADAEADDAAKKRRKTKNKAAIVLTVVFNLLILGFLKYYNFLGDTFNSLLAYSGAKFRFPILSLALPLGISFYTLTAIGYLTDVYRKKYPPEKNLAKICLFLSFFPQILEGPICRYDQTGKKLFEGENAGYEGFIFGLQRILWGLFKKMVVADRLFMLVNTVFSDPAQYSGVASIMVIVCYTIQLYADFSGFIDIALGSAEMFGIKLPENFRQPFFAKSAQEFWQRWHITLGLWLKEYVFYSVALSPKVLSVCGKIKKRWKNHFTKTLPTVLALFAVWICNGIWHGPEWKYIVYGMYYFVIIFISLMTEPLFKKFYAKVKINPQNKFLNACRHLRTILIILIGETIFGANSLGDAFMILGSVFRPYQGSIFSLGLDWKELVIALLGAGMMLVVGILKERKVDIRAAIASKVLPLRWAPYLAMVVFIAVFGAYGEFYSVVPFIYGAF